MTSQIQRRYSPEEKAAFRLTQARRALVLLEASGLRGIASDMAQLTIIAFADLRMVPDGKTRTGAAADKAKAALKLTKTQRYEARNAIKEGYECAQRVLQTAYRELNSRAA